jgi:hypothetical protein
MNAIAPLRLLVKGLLLFAFLDMMFGYFDPPVGKLSIFNAEGIPLLVVNEPIFRATGQNSDIRYNKYYPRWAYDIYRSHLAEWMQKNRGLFADLWDAMQNSEFMGSPLHLDPKGEQQLASEIGARILGVSRP